MTMTSTGICLVTGGAGFIGSYIVPALCDQFARVVVLDNLHPQVHPSGAKPADFCAKADLVVGSVADATVWPEVLKHGCPDAVIHLAAETGTGQSLTEASRHAEVNVLGTTRMLDALSARGWAPKNFVLASSRAVYGEGAWRASGSDRAFYPPQRSHAQLKSAAWDYEGAVPLPHDAETTVPKPTSIYGATKLSQENLLSSWAAAYGSALAILRFQNVYGPGQSLINSYTGIVTLFMRIARQGEAINVFEDGEMLRDFVFVEDVARSILAVTRRDASLPTPVDIGSGKATTINEAAALIAKRYDAPAPRISGQYRNGDVRHAVATIAAARDVLGWSPQVSVADGFEKLCVWYDGLQGA